jgi:hypothetical protein
MSNQQSTTWHIQKVSTVWLYKIYTSCKKCLFMAIKFYIPQSNFWHQHHWHWGTCHSRAQGFVCPVHRHAFCFQLCAATCSEFHNMLLHWVLCFVGGIQTTKFPTCPHTMHMVFLVDIICLVAHFCEQGIQILVSCYDKCLSVGGAYVKN